MKTEELFSKSYGNFKVRTYKILEINTIVYEMEGFMLKNFIDEYIADLIEQAKIHHPKAMIADPRKMKTLSEEVQQAVAQNFWPEIVKLGVQYNPVVMPESVLSSNSVDRMIQNSNQTLDIKGSKLELGTFSSFDECVNWVTDKVSVAS